MYCINAQRNIIYLNPRNAVVLTFGLKDKNASLGLSTCACIIVRGGKGKDGKPVVRAYTPVSTNAVFVCVFLIVCEFVLRSFTLF